MAPPVPRSVTESPSSLASPQTDIPLDVENDSDYRPNPLHPSLPFTTLVRCLLKAYSAGYLITFLPGAVRVILKLAFRVHHEARKGRGPGYKALCRSLNEKLKRVAVKSLSGRVPWFLVVLVGGFRVSEWVASSGWKGAVRIVSRVAGLLRAKEEYGPHGEEETHAKKVLQGLEKTLEYEQTSSKEEKDEGIMDPATVTPLHPILTPTFVAGALSSSLALLVIPPSSRSDIAVFTMVRAMDSVVGGYYPVMKPWLDKWVPSWIQGNFDTAIFVASCTEIMWSWFYLALPRSYVKWITKMANMDTRLIDALQKFRSGELVYGQDNGSKADFLCDMAEDIGLPRWQGDPANGLIACTLAHGGIEGCAAHKAAVWRRGFFDALKIYIPVHVLPTLLFHRKRLFSLATLPTTIRIITISVLRSSTFLATFIATIWTAICVLRNYLGRDTPMGPLLGSFLCGFSLLLERKGRRREMGLYCLPKAVQSAWWRLTGGKTVVPNGEVFMFAVGMGYLLSAFVHCPKMVRPAVQGLLGFFLV
ncbi:hypothetical protein HK104_008373 [Borealophlyctis nickersoniae]|nr:hypothetical protein HK104_008373 [Borealophlyctis nickersoniae]